MYGSWYAYDSAPTVPENIPYAGVYKGRKHDLARPFGDLVQQRECIFNSTRDVVI